MAGVDEAEDVRQGVGPESLEPESPRQGESRESWLEMLVTWLSGVALLLAAGYLVWDGLGGRQQAEFLATVEGVSQLSDSFHLRLEVSNTGGQSVQDLALLVELRDGGDVVESSSVTVDWLPEGSSREVVLIFPADPSEHEVVTRFQGYQVP